ncbi:MAG: HAD family hydrolase [Gammaproteobacteria bacterium]|nr:HAD family hydrolase [Gammaproteobacteria bacterium]
MALAIFDLDHTLLNGDSDYLWGEYMVENKIVDRTEYRQINQSFAEDYHRGELDNDKYLQFALHPLSQHSMGDLLAWRADYVEKWIKPIIANGTPDLLEKHRQQKDTLIIISATNFFITRPIADLLDIPNLLSTRPELIDDRYTGNYIGIPTFREGKVLAINQWLTTQQHSLADSYFYSDSMNDLALLEQVGYPVAVNPDNELQNIAKARNWRIMDLRS